MGEVENAWGGNMWGGVNGEVRIGAGGVVRIGAGLRNSGRSPE